MTGEMFGGLRHRNMKAKGRAIGWIQITASRDYPVEGAQCTCAAVNSVREIMKFITTNTLTGPAYLEMLKKSYQLMLVAVQLSRYRQVRVTDAAVHCYLRRPFADDG